MKKSHPRNIRQMDLGFEEKSPQKIKQLDLGQRHMRWDNIKTA